MPVIPQHDLPQVEGRKKSTPVFSPEDISVIFVLGGPGAGKGTQCASIVRDYGFTHLSAGDLLRAEQDREGSEFGQMIKKHIEEGKIVPMEVTVQLLENGITDDVKDKGGKGKFLIDGFPRKMDQALKFDQEVCPSAFTLFFDCPEETMHERLISRGKTSGRADDNEESIKKRFKTFIDTSMPVIENFRKEDKVETVSAVPGPDEVYKDVQSVMSKRGFKRTS